MCSVIFQGLSINFLCVSYFLCVAPCGSLFGSLCVVRCSLRVLVVEFCRGVRCVAVMVLVMRLLLLGFVSCDGLSWIGLTINTSLCRSINGTSLLMANPKLFFFHAF